VTEPEPPLDHLSTEDLLEIAAGVVEDVQVLDLGLLASAAARPRTTVFGREAYPTLADQAAALMHWTLGHVDGRMEAKQGGHPHDADHRVDAEHEDHLTSVRSALHRGIRPAFR
jgi:hypothetical protein